MRFFPFSRFRTSTIPLFFLCLFLSCPFSARADDTLPVQPASEAAETTDDSPDSPPLLPGEAVLVDADAANLGLSSPSCILMEASTGTVLYETDKDSRRSPASITKIMTLLLIFDALESGAIHLQDSVVTSAYAKSMGGSQVFLEEGEVQTVETLIKCIVVASGNDASVAMAEHIAGSESEFVRQMNARAKSLGMENTNFEDCCGLTDSDGHYSSAHDIAIMARELIRTYPQIRQYATIWMDTITHVTRQGSKEFGLSNTNRLLKMNHSFTVTGLKTGSTAKAKYCLCATAEKDGIELIAVVMACPNYKDRFSEAASLLNFGYASCSLYEDPSPPAVPPVPVKNGVSESVSPKYASIFSYLSTTGEDFSQIEREIVIDPGLTAPVRQGQTIGHVTYRLSEKTLGQVDLIAAEAVEKAGYKDYLLRLFQRFLL